MTSVHTAKENLAEVEPDARKIFAESALSRDPNRLNVFLFMLDERGEVVHECHGVPGGRRSGPDRSDWSAEIAKSLEKLILPKALPPLANQSPLRSLPDLADGTASGLPAGVRIFVRQGDPSSSPRGHLPIVEVVPMKPDDWKPLAWSPETRTIEAANLRDWLVWLYPAAIRTADESKRFQKFEGSLVLEPTGRDDTSRHALLRGEIHLSKGSESQSEFEGKFEAVLTYRLNSPHLQSVRAVVEGVYLYRQRGTNPQKLRAVIESRPGEPR